MESLTGSVERITYYNPENGYCVARLKPERQKVPVQSRDGLVTITGNLPELTPGEHLRLEGAWSQHPKHGMQFQVTHCEQILPATVAGIRRYLGSGLVKGIGPRLAERIVSQFGIHTLEVIESQPERLLEVTDIGPKRTRQIAGAWEEQKQVKEIMLFLHSYGISTNLAIKIYKQYGDQSLPVVKSDPYRLARDIYGIGFKTADKIAQALGLSIDHPSRIEAGIVYVLNELSEDGHVYAPDSLLIEQAARLLEVNQDLLPPALDRLAADKRIQREVIDTPAQPDITQEHIAREKPPAYGIQAIYLTPLYYSEVGVAEKLHRLSEAKTAYKTTLRLNSREIQLSEEQQSGIQSALISAVSILTGGPGTGKTTCIKALINTLEAAHRRYALASPTGRAAKRLSEATGKPASTIHRLLGYVPGEGFKYNAENPLPVDMLVIDETSMLELVLANHLLKAICPGTHLLFVGDVDQLPSVGAGDVLRDVISSNLGPVTRLGQIFRQAADSHIITNAHRINQGQMPLFPKAVAEAAQKNDFYLFPAETAEETSDWVVDVVTQRIPRTFGFQPPGQIQVLSPMYRGAAGVLALNARLQEALNPPLSQKPEKILFGTLFRLGDKVMQIQNNYDKEVFNGDIGQIVALDMIDHSLTVEFDGRKVAYDWTEADQLVLAYAISVHKAQGSEFPVVVMPIITAHYMMLQRNLLYTAVTRARKLCVLVGSKKAIGIAVRNNRVTQRYTALDWRLTNLIK